LVSTVFEFVYVSAGGELGGGADVVGVVGMDGDDLSQEWTADWSCGMDEWVGNRADSYFDAISECERKVGDFDITFWCDLGDCNL